MSITTDKTRKQFLKKLRSPKGEEQGEMTFMDHLEALRWHLARGVLVWLVAMIAIFINIDWVFDNVIMAPANPGF
ncbi:MAG: hypothetical protein EOO13_14510, partial [Chitinophagaceae bacterium]